MNLICSRDACGGSLCLVPEETLVPSLNLKRGFLYLTAIIDWYSRWADNIMIERWFRTFKYDEAYLTEWHNIKEARQAIAAYIHTYNFERCHSAIGNVPPAAKYYPTLLYEAAKDVA